MADQQTKKIWQGVLGEMEVLLPKMQFNTWFKNTELEIGDEGVATVYCGNSFGRDWLKSKHHQQILDAIRKGNDDVLKVEYKVKTQNNLERLKLEVRPEEPSPVEKNPLNPLLNANYTFDKMVVGNNNSLAYAVAKEIAGSPGKKHNPLFIYGGVGLGKTHLAQAIGHEVASRTPKTKIVYVSCETFTNDFISAIASKRMSEFKKTYREADILIVDDIQFLSSKEGSQEEFFHTFNSLHQKARQIILTADKTPQAIPALEGRLQSRFGGGMVVDIQPPNYETRIAILNEKCKEKNQFIPDEVIEFIAKGVTTNIRELEGALNRLLVYCQFNDAKPSTQIAQEVLKDMIKSINKKVDSAEIIAEVCRYFSVEAEDLVSKKRKKELVIPRQIAIYLMREKTAKSLPEIGKIMGGKDHTTILHSEKKITGLLKTDVDLKRVIDEIREMILSVES